MNKATDFQNESFRGLFDALKKQGAGCTAEAHAVIVLDDSNFTRLYLDPDTEIVGTDEELATINARAKYLEL